MSNRTLQILLQLLRLDPSKDASEITVLADAGTQTLNRVRSQPEPILPLGSNAGFAFDPKVTRRLHNFLPTRLPVYPSRSATWNIIESLFSGWKEIGLLLNAQDLRTWEVRLSLLSYHVYELIVFKSAGSLRIWAPSRSVHKSLIRSLIQVSSRSSVWKAQ